jgi:hypothetical protein
VKEVVSARTAANVLLIGFGALAVFTPLSVVLAAAALRLAMD